MEVIFVVALCHCLPKDGPFWPSLAPAPGVPEHGPAGPPNPFTFAQPKGPRRTPLPFGGPVFRLPNPPAGTDADTLSLVSPSPPAGPAL